MGRIDELSADEIERLLRTAIVGRIACCAHGIDGSVGRPYVVPLAYGYDGDAIYAHSGIGRKIRMMRAQPLVTVEVDRADAPDRWQSVIAEGTYEEINDVSLRSGALAIIYPDETTRPDLEPSTIVYRIRLTAKTGRYEVPD